MTNIYLASKPRYEILDGLRGVAAVLVVIFHLFETYSPGVVHQIINHGYLAESWKMRFHIRHRAIISRVPSRWADP